MRQISGTTIISLVDNMSNHVVEGQIEAVPTTGLPTTASTYAVGCRIADKSTGISWYNTGTVASPVWSRQGSSATNDPQTVQMSLITLAPADFVATGSGQLSSANGLTLVAPAATGYVNVWHRTIVSYTYSTAAYTGGGNTTVAISGGGSALSGLIATTSLWQASANVIYEFVPLSTVAFPITTATGISLKTASAITQPGTAAGTAKVYTWYSTVAI